MDYTLYLYIALILFGLGILYRLAAWFRGKIGSKAREISFMQRILAAVKGVFGIVFSAKILTLLKALLLDAILQRKIFIEDKLRWTMHMCIYGGFMLLLLMHALHKIISVNIFSDYYSTLNPFMFLRDLFGVMVIIGILIAVYRRVFLKSRRLATNTMDVYLIIMVAIIIISGIVLEGLKITSYKVYNDMIEEYGEADNDTEYKALEAYWIKEFSLVSPNKIEITPKLLTLGAEVHDMNCSSCHSKPQWAFTGYVTAVVIKPVARVLDENNLTTILFYIHVIVCLMALAYMPFSKMFHMFVTPLALVTSAVMDDESDPANIATRQVMELDACVHCGTCSLRCSALAAFQGIGNPDVLPSEKMQHIKALVNGKKLDGEKLRLLQEGVYLCTNCDRCTVVCPSGIQLRELWYNVREDLIGNGYALPFILSPLSFCRNLATDDTDSSLYKNPINNARGLFTGKLDKIKEDETVSLSNIDVENLKEARLDDRRR